MLSNVVRVFDLDLREYVEKLWDKKIPIVRHAVVEAVGLSVDDLSEKNLTEKIEVFCKRLDLHVVKRFQHKFEPQGITFVYVLEESHLAIHTWPEKGYLHLDIVTCTKEDLQSVILVNEFVKFFQPLSTRAIKFKY